MDEKKYKFSQACVPKDDSKSLVVVVVVSPVKVSAFQKAETNLLEYKGMDDFKASSSVALGALYCLDGFIVFPLKCISAKAVHAVLPLSVCFWQKNKKTSSLRIQFIVKTQQILLPFPD